MPANKAFDAARIQALDFPDRGKEALSDRCRILFGPARLRVIGDAAVRLAGVGRRASSAQSNADMRTRNRTAFHLVMQADAQMVGGSPRGISVQAICLVDSLGSEQSGWWPGDPAAKLPNGRATIHANRQMCRLPPNQLALYVPC